MRRMKSKLLSFSVLFSFAFCTLFIFSFNRVNAVDADAATISRAECVTEISSLRFLHEHHSETTLPLASTTKILTAIIVIDDCDLDETITIPKEAEGTEGSSVYLRAGDQYTVEDLLYGLMLRSGNDCAVTLALHHSGSIEAFAKKMTEKAMFLGAEHSRFVNPHGLPDARHYTTARDLSLISAYAMKNEKFREIVSCKYYEPRNWQNKNKMLYRYEGAIGVKTGFTLAAGRCLVTAAERNGMTVVCVVLNSPQMYERTTELLDFAFEKYEMTQLCSPDENVNGFSVKYDFSYPLTKTEREKVRTEIEIVSPLPEQEGDIAGQMKIMLENNLLFSQNLYMMNK